MPVTRLSGIGSVCGGAGPDCAPPSVHILWTQWQVRRTLMRSSEAKLIKVPCRGDVMRLRNARLLMLAVASVSLPGCMSASQHRADVSNPASDRVTVGTVQKEIRVGMSGAEVATVLGSPNIVSTDEERREVWIYDKISTDVAYSTSSGGLSALILGGGSGVGGGVGGSAGRNAGASSTSQKTLTVIIKFDDAKKVRDFAYHTSSF